MKSFTRKVLVAALIAAPVASFAQSNQPVSREQVRAELAQVEKAGYNPRDGIHYPENIQAAEAKVTAQNATAQAGVSGYGGVANGTSRSGSENGM
ncbi:DUF4148 domain-containing protein [Paraburkholderia sp. IMGN_8]|uniref:DUF4148 domain-containing protein n=1 Tax=Paraburkholderia sp. IMGN_8 TaxID=3136564 RepID=UPI0031012657